MVGGSASGAVVARMNTAHSGGSSSVFRNALAPSLVSMCASSMMYTLLRIAEGANFTASRNARISSIPRFEAASISSTSSAVPSRIATQFSHVLSGVAVGPFTQSMQRARIFAADVLPEPRGPGEQVRVREPTRFQGRRQRLDHGVLADQVGERPGPPGSVERHPS